MGQKQDESSRVMRILLVEDNPDDVEITRKAFERAKIGNPITVMENGKAALDLLYRNCIKQREPGFDLVLLDLSLPGMDGLTVLRSIWADKRLRHTAVIILTGSEREADLIAAYKGGAVAFLRKPVEVERLLAAIGDLHGYRLLITRTAEAA